MSKEIESEKIKPKVEELQKKIEDLRELSEKYKTELEDRVRAKPLESAGLIFIAGLIVGIILGTSTSKRS